MKHICLVCKGSNPKKFCGRGVCPIVAKNNSILRAKKTSLKKDFSGSSPAPFVGRFGYPNISVGIMAPPDIFNNVWKYDAPRFWAEQSYKIPEIIDLRSSLVNSGKNVHIKHPDKIIELSKEVAMASKPVGVELNLKDKPFFRVSYSDYTAPTGGKADLIKAKLTENPKISSKVDKVYSQTDLKAVEAVRYLYKKGFDENFLTKILSVGTVGFKDRRKLVPTRWSITAVDDALGNQLRKNIEPFNEINFQSYFGGYLGNYYLILFFPENWSYELFEMYLPKASWNVQDKLDYTTDYEGFHGRKDYAAETTGGYYACRLPILEKLNQLGKKGSVLCLRFITGEYAVPLGVWVCREATRKSLNSKPIEFGSKELMLKYATIFAKKKFGINIEPILKKSILLKEFGKQRKVWEFS